MLDRGNGFLRGAGLCAGLPGAWADNPFHEDRQLAKVGSKIFCFPGPTTMSVKNTAEKVEELKRRYPDAAGTAPYLDKRLWVQVQIEPLPDEEVRELIEDSYELVVAKLPVKERPGAH